MIVGIMGIQCVSENLGVQALGTSILHFLSANYPFIDKILVFSSEKQEVVEAFAKSMSLEEKKLVSVSRSYKNRSSIREIIHNIKQCELILDFTGGDSFSSIYGGRRLMKSILDKLLAVHYGKKLVLMPQTYGPFDAKWSAPLLSYILNKSTQIFSRDKESIKDIRRYTRREVCVVTDFAFFLPYQSRKQAGTGKKAGVNISGLLWNGGYHGDNQFQLRVDYPSFCRRLIVMLHQMGYEIVLFPHVITVEENSRENDLKVCRQFCQEYSFCAMAPAYQDPILAKSYISEMDVFLGSRMHATIGALSAGVPTIPLSYSKKFYGLFSNIGYEVEVSLRELDEEKAIAQIKEYLDHSEELKKKVEAALVLIHRYQEKIRCQMDKLLGGEERAENDKG
ncbi:MAG: polysaccharide pyruvyl transferase family protein [Lachnospiraceae bacterium]|nr:polysaccharide pyruvyl transferase family protein [Lachnospiraceae bacterium]